MILHPKSKLQTLVCDLPLNPNAIALSTFLLWKVVIPHLFKSNLKLTWTASHCTHIKLRTRVDEGIPCACWWNLRFCDKISISDELEMRMGWVFPVIMFMAVAHSGCAVIRRRNNRQSTCWPQVDTAPSVCQYMYEWLPLLVSRWPHAKESLPPVCECERAWMGESWSSSVNCFEWSSFVRCYRASLIRMWKFTEADPWALLLVGRHYSINTVLVCDKLLEEATYWTGHTHNT